MGITLGVLSGAGCTGPDHFKVYDVDDVAVEDSVYLTDQFDPQSKQATVVALTHFANPVHKILEDGSESKIQNKHRHLTWYRLNQQQPEPRRTVRFRNQFGQQSVDIRQAQVLLVPTQKLLESDSEFPKNLDHYKCYRIIQVNVPPEQHTLTLIDQFETQENVQLGPPVLFCPPVKKERPGYEEQPIQKPRDHLTIYRIEEHAFQRDFGIHDQFFEEQGLVTSRSVFLAVPTTKEAFVTHNDEG